VPKIEWEEPFWVKQPEVAADKEFIFTLKAGQTSVPTAVAGGFQVYRLIEKKERHVVTLEERYKEIVDILRRPLYQDLMDKYKKHLFETNSVLYLHGVPEQS
jgi:parvulin-like peptidyl-prolyl isomerase